MRKGGSKSKGSTFERMICKDLSLWISKGKAADVYWRSAMSGGRSTVAMKKGEKLSAQVGDISSIHKLGHAFIDKFMVECKFYKLLNYDSIIRDKGKLIEFWERAQEDAETHGKMPMLVAKQNNFPIVVCLSSKGVRTLCAKKYLVMRVYKRRMYLLHWEDFLKLDPTVLKPKRRVKL